MAENQPAGKEIEVPEGLRLDYILDPEYCFFQDPKQYCFNTDTVLLALFARIRPEETIMEIGTNNAALLRFLDRYPIKQAIGVEILPAAAEVARKNMETFFRHPARVILQDAKSLELDEPVDHILCNPPFFTLEESGLVIQDPRQMGRVEYNLDLESMIQTASRLLGSNGRFTFLHRPDRMYETLQLLKQYHFGLKRFQVVYDRRNDLARSVLYECVKDFYPRTIVEPAGWIPVVWNKEEAGPSEPQSKTNG